MKVVSNNQVFSFCSLYIIGPVASVSFCSDVFCKDHLSLMLFSAFQSVHTKHRGTRAEQLGLVVGQGFLVPPYASAQTVHLGQLPPHLWGKPQVPYPNAPPRVLSDGNPLRPSLSARPMWVCTLPQSALWVPSSLSVPAWAPHGRAHLDSCSPCAKRIAYTFVFCSNPMHRPGSRGSDGSPVIRRVGADPEQGGYSSRPWLNSQPSRHPGTLLH